MSRVISLRVRIALAQIYYYSTCSALCLWYNQRIILYPLGFTFMNPWYRTFIRTPAVSHEVVELVAKDKVKLQTLLIPHASSTSLRGTVIIFHGNAMNHGDIIEPHAVILSKLGFTVLAAEYRGYGGSEGKPSESGLRRDAQAAFDFVANHPELSKVPIVIYGQSLGGAVAIDVTSRNVDKVSALMIENTFRSIPHLVRRWPMGRFLSLLTTQKWYSASKIARMPSSLPILMLSGLRDDVIPSSEMEGLWEIAKTRPKKQTKWWRFLFGQKNDKEGPTQPEKDVFKEFRRGGHCDTYQQHGYWVEVIKFLDDTVPFASA